jgi:hypothetical protein
MRPTSLNYVLARIAVVFAAPILIAPNAFAQQFAQSRAAQNADQAAFQTKLQQVSTDKATVVANIASKWEADARASGKWDSSYTTDMQTALMKLQPANLAAAADATSYSALLRILRNGAPIPNAALVLKPNGDPATIPPSVDAGIGDFGDNLLYNPINPCRIVDTRNAGGAIAGGTTRSFDVDNPSSFAFQGGFNGPCGIPFGVAAAVEMTVTTTNAAAPGYITAWAVGAPQPLASILNYYPGVNIADTVIVPVLPGSGNDFFVFSSATSDLVVDVLGYFARPVATPLNCTIVSTANTPVPINTWTAIDAICPTGFTPTGGGYDTPEGTLGYPGVWVTTLPLSNGWRTWVDNQTNGSRQIQTFANCCQIPGR